MKNRGGLSTLRASVGRGAQVIAATSAVAGFEAGAAEVNEPAGGQGRGEEDGEPQGDADRSPARLEGVSRIDESEVAEAEAVPDGPTRAECVQGRRAGGVPR